MCPAELDNVAPVSVDHREAGEVFGINKAENTVDLLPDVALIKEPEIHWKIFLEMKTSNRYFGYD